MSDCVLTDAEVEALGRYEPGPPSNDTILVLVHSLRVVRAALRDALTVAERRRMRDIEDGYAPAMWDAIIARWRRALGENP